MFPTDSLHGACTRRAAVRSLSEKRVRTAIADGTFASPWPGVLVDPTRAAEPKTIIAAGLLAGGPGARVGGPTAANLHGLSAAQPAPVHLTVPYGNARRTREGLILHNGRSLVADACVVDGLPTLDLDRVLTDILCTLRYQDALAVVDQALALLPREQRRACRERVHERLRRRPDPRGTRIGARLLDLATGLAESPAESWTLWRIVDLGFPVPEVNHWVCDIDGTPRYRLDLCWPELRIVLEYDGHLAHLGRGDADAGRDEDLRRRGWTVIRLDIDDLKNPGRVEQELHDAFASRGVHLRGRTTRALRALPHRERRAG